MRKFDTKIRIMSYWQAFCLFWGLCFGLRAQQETIPMLYPLMPTYLNPAEVGAKDVTRVLGLYRRRIVLIPNTAGLNQQFLSIDGYLPKGQWGLGFMGFNTGVAFTAAGSSISPNLGLGMMLSKRVSWGRGHRLQVGASLGGRQYPVLGSRGANEFQGSAAWGIFYEKEDWSMGLSMPNLALGSINANAPKWMYARSQYLFRLPNQDHLKLGLVSRSLSNLEQLTLDLHAVYWYAEKVGIGAYYLANGTEFKSKALVNTLEINLSPHFRLAYSFDYNRMHSLQLAYFTDGGRGKVALFRP